MAKRFSPPVDRGLNPVAIRSKVNQSDVLASSGDDLEAALAAAREASSYAERTVAALTKLARSRAAESEQPSSAADALKSANVALIALQSAVAADPGNSSLERALAETKRAVTSLERKSNRFNTTAGSTSEDH